MHKLKIFASSLMILMSSYAYSTGKLTQEGEPETPFKRIRGMLEEIYKFNEEYVEGKNPCNNEGKDKKPVILKQYPRSTIVTCSDSRVQSPAIDLTPENDLFTIRNIGNQIETSKGSVKYGMKGLEIPSPALIIIGHTKCGAIEGALSDYSSYDPDIRKELATIDIPDTIAKKHQNRGASSNSKAVLEEDAKAPAGTETPNIPAKKDDKPGTPARGLIEEGAIENVHKQVEKARRDIIPMLRGQGGEQQDCMVFGFICDIIDYYKQGVGRLFLINVDGEQDPAKFMKHEILKDLPFKTLNSRKSKL